MNFPHLRVHLKSGYEVSETFIVGEAGREYRNFDSCVVRLTMANQER